MIVLVGTNLILSFVFFLDIAFTHESSYICLDGGTNFSQGQWQLIDMACALVCTSIGNLAPTTLSPLTIQTGHG